MSLQGEGKKPQNKHEKRDPNKRTSGPTLSGIPKETIKSKLEARKIFKIIKSAQKNNVNSQFYATHVRIYDSETTSRNKQKAISANTGGAARRNWLSSGKESSWSSSG